MNAPANPALLSGKKCHLTSQEGMILTEFPLLWHGMEVGHSLRRGSHTLSQPEKTAQGKVHFRYT